MQIDTLFIDYDRYLITIDEVPIGTEPCSIGEAIVVKAWLRKNGEKLQGFFDQKSGWEIIEEMKQWSLAWRDAE